MDEAHSAKAPLTNQNVLSALSLADCDVGGVKLPAVMLHVRPASLLPAVSVCSSSALRNVPLENLKSESYRYTYIKISRITALSLMQSQFQFNTEGAHAANVQFVPSKEHIQMITLIMKWASW